MSNKMYPIILGNKRDNNPTKVGICGMPPGMMYGPIYFRTERGY